MLPIRRCRRIATVLLLRRAQELVLCVERIAANGVTPATARAILQLVAWRANIQEPDWSVSELLCIVGVFATGQPELIDIGADKSHLSRQNLL